MRSDRTPRDTADEVAQRVRALLGDGLQDGTPADSDVGGIDPAQVGEQSPQPRQVRLGWRDRLLSRVPVRVDPGRRGALAVGVAVLVVAIACGAWLLSSRPRSVPIEASASGVPRTEPLVGTDGATRAAASSSGIRSTGTGSTSSRSTSSGSGSGSGSGAGGSASTSSVVVVDVAGRVRRPGVYRLPAGSRVNDALRAAGGPVGRVDLSRLNLAAPLVDGEQVPVGVRAADGSSSGATAVPGGTQGGSSASSSGPVDLNTATLEQLESLPGVGPVLGQDILDYRNAHGSFSSVGQLQNVSGIGDVKFGALKSLVTV